MLAVPCAATTLGVLPVFLLGALAVHIRLELGFGPARLGVTLATFSATSALSSIALGRVVERLGASHSFRVGVVGAGVCLGGVGLIADTWMQLITFLVVGGCANALIQPAANLAIARGVRPSQQGVAFGIKQAAVPAATFVGGLSVPLVAAWLGWRWAYGLGALVCLLLLVSVPELRASTSRRRRRARSRSSIRPLTPLILFALTSLLGTAAVTATAGFLVEGGVDQGLSPGLGGLTLAAGSVIGIVLRIVVGAWVDRTARSHAAIMAGVLLASAVGFVALASGTGGMLYLVGGLLGFGVGWGWNGLLNYSVVRGKPHAPAAATSVTMTGLYVGAAAGPIVFGILVEHASFEAAWMAAALAMSVAAASAIGAGRWSKAVPA